MLRKPVLRGSARTQPPCLPDGSMFSPPWNARDDHCLGDAMQMEMGSLAQTLSLNIEGISERRLPSDVIEFLEGILLFFRRCAGARLVTRAELIDRITMLRDTFGRGREDFELFRRVARNAALQLSAKQDPRPCDDAIKTHWPPASGDGSSREMKDSVSHTPTPRAPDEVAALRSLQPDTRVSPKKRLRISRDAGAMAPTSKKRSRSESTPLSSGAASTRNTRTGSSQQRNRAAVAQPQRRNCTTGTTTADPNVRLRKEVSAAAKTGHAASTWIDEPTSAEISFTPTSSKPEPLPQRIQDLSAKFSHDLSASEHATAARTPCTGARGPPCTAVDQSIVHAARRSVLRQLNARVTGDGANLAAKLHPEAHCELTQQLRRTAHCLENTSVLLIGQKGVGKHRLLQSALRHLQVEQKVDYLVVHLHPLLLPDESSALMAVAAQLNVTHALLRTSRFGSFCDGLRFVLHVLRRAHPGATGEARREAQAQPVCFILHDFERFAQRPKQTLLYSLFDLAQTDDAQMAVVGLTTLLDAADLLEKRVRSRFSGRQLLLRPLRDVHDAGVSLQAALTIAEEASLISALCEARPHLLRKSGKQRDDGVAAVVQEQGVHEFCRQWNQSVEVLVRTVAHSKKLHHCLELGLPDRKVRSAAALSLSKLDAENPYPSLDALEDAIKQLAPPAIEATLEDLSVLELMLLLCLKKLGDKDVAPPHTLRLVLLEYAEFLRSAQAAQITLGSQFELSNAPLARAFEHLCSLGLVSADSGHRGVVSLHQVSLHLNLSPERLRRYITTTTSIPLPLKEFDACRLG